MSPRARADFECFGYLGRRRLGGVDEPLVYRFHGTNEGFKSSPDIVLDVVELQVDAGVALGDHLAGYVADLLYFRTDGAALSRGIVRDRSPE